jgi:hypothetical protein
MIQPLTNIPVLYRPVEWTKIYGPEMVQVLVTGSFVGQVNDNYIDLPTHIHENGNGHAYGPFIRLDVVSVPNSGWFLVDYRGDLPIVYCARAIAITTTSADLYGFETETDARDAASAMKSRLLGHYHDWIDHVNHGKPLDFDS